MKRSKILQWPRARGHLQSETSPRCSEEALSLHAGCPQGLQHLFLHIPAGFYCLQLLSKASQERGLGQVWSGNKKSWSVAVGLTNVRMLTVPVGTLISLSHHQELHVKRKSFAFRYCGRELSFETRVTLIAQFHFSKTEMSWSVRGDTEPQGPVELLPRDFHDTFSRRKKDSWVERKSSLGIRTEL